MKNSFFLTLLIAVMLLIGNLGCKHDAGAPALVNQEEFKVNNDIVPNAVSGQVINIPNSYGVTDHSDPTIKYSIAWYIDSIGPGTASAPNVFYLTSKTPYYNIKKRLTLPPNITLSGGLQDDHSVISCDAVNWSLSAREAISLSSNTRLQKIQLNVNWKALYGVYANQADKPFVKDAIIQQTRKARWSTGIYLDNCTNARVEGTMLRRAGCDDNETNLPYGDCYLISVRAGNNITIANNNMAVSASGGIGFNATVNMYILNNLIRDTGRALNPGFIADGITCYHNQLGNIDRNIWILENTIQNSRNHGMHLSGWGIHVKRNKMSNSGMYTAANHILIDDHKDPKDCSGNVEIMDNNLENCPLQGGAAIRYGRRAGMFTITGNTGCVNVATNPACGVN